MPPRLISITRVNFFDFISKALQLIDKNHSFGMLGLHNLLALYYPPMVSYLSKMIGCMSPGIDGTYYTNILP